MSWICHITRHQHGHTPGLPHDAGAVGGVFFVEIRNQDIRAYRRKRKRHGAANAAVGASSHGCLPGKAAGSLVRRLAMIGCGLQRCQGVSAVARAASCFSHETDKMTWRFGAGWFRHRLWRVQRRLLRRTTNQCCRVAMRAAMRSWAAASAHQHPRKAGHARHGREQHP